MRKSLIIVLIATLVLGSVMVSCNSDVSGFSSNGEKLVTIGIIGDGSKGVTATSTPDGAGEYFWYYTATKTDSSVYRTGQTSEWTPIMGTGENSTNWTPGLANRSLGKFSAGDWKFSFRGYAEKQTAFGEDYMYYQTDLAVNNVVADRKIDVTFEAKSQSGTTTVVFGTSNEKLNWRYSPESGTGYTATLQALNNATATMKIWYATGSNIAANATSWGDVWVSGSGTVSSTSSDAEASFSISDGTLNGSVSGTAYTLRIGVFVGSEQVGTYETVNVMAYANGKIEIRRDGTGYAVNSNEQLYDITIEKAGGVVTVETTSESKAFSTSDNVTSNSGIIEVASNKSPASVTGTNNNNETKVTIPAGAVISSSNSTSQTVVLSRTLYSTEASASNASFVVGTSTSAAVAGIDLNLSVDGTAVTNFKDYVFVETHIAKGLTNVTVAYNGEATDHKFSGQILSSDDAVRNYNSSDDALDGTGYCSTTGLIRFKTKHFSEFFFPTTDQAVNVTKGQAYSALKDAINSAESYDTIILLNNIEYGQDSDFENRYGYDASIHIDKSMTIEGNGKTISGVNTNLTTPNKKMAIAIWGNEGVNADYRTVVINNLRLNFSGFGYGINALERIKCYVNNCDITVNGVGVCSNGGAVQINNNWYAYPENAEVYVNGGSITSTSGISEDYKRAAIMATYGGKLVSKDCSLTAKYPIGFASSGATVEYFSGNISKYDSTDIPELHMYKNDSCKYHCTVDGTAVDNDNPLDCTLILHSNYANYYSNGNITNYIKISGTNISQVSATENEGVLTLKYHQQ